MLRARDHRNLVIYANNIRCFERQDCARGGTEGVKLVRRQGIQHTTLPGFETALTSRAGTTTV